MNPNYREIGLGVIAENNPASSVGPFVVTEDFGRNPSGPSVFVLGVAYDDTDLNKFYSVGEGRAGISGSPTFQVGSLRSSLPAIM